MKKIFILILMVSLGSCSSGEEDPQDIIDKNLEASGTKNLENAEVSFVFRDRNYTASFNSGLFEYVRQFTDSVNSYSDVVNNAEFYRKINGRRVDIPDSMAARYRSSVNAVIYFALLPRGLNDAAVNKKYLGSKKIKGEDYHKIKITFDQQGGGKDYQDEFIYWINKADYTIDYLAYEYHTDGGGMRFREAYNERMINGVRFVDYVNYKPKLEILLKEIDDAFINGQLEKVSIIESENVRVKKL